MKYIVILGDGMADDKYESLENKSPLQAANKPTIDSLAKVSEVGLVRTVPLGMKPGSDVANLSVLGYNPKDNYTGRSPLEAASMGIVMNDTDIALRANLVTVSFEDDYRKKTMVDYSAGEISSEEAKILIDYLAENLPLNACKLYAGVSYRHCLIAKDVSLNNDFTPPHDISGKEVATFLPTGENADFYRELMIKSYELLKDHPLNKERVKRGKNPANSLWFWGQGTKPNVENFYEKFGKEGGIISAVDLLKGIGKLAGMKVIEVEGATGNYDTNFTGKANACLNNLKSGLDLVYIHMEAPDECGHQGDLEHKVFSIEQIDKLVVKPIIEELNRSNEEFSMLILPDHPTPVKIRTHTATPVPYLLYRSNKNFPSNAESYDEDQAKATDIFEEVGHNLMARFLKD